jgi:hypothetical protein
MNDESCIPDGDETDTLYIAINLVSYDYLLIPVPTEYDGAGWRTVAWRYIHFLNGLQTWQSRAPAVDALLRFLCSIEDKGADLTELLIRKLSALLDNSLISLPTCQALYETLTGQDELAAGISRASSPDIID